LEVGPGTFLVSDALKRRGYDVTTCDFDPGLGADVTADVRKLPFGDSSFYLVMACQVLEHIPFEEFDKAVAELRRVAARSVLVSLPHRQTGLTVLLRFPLIETLFKRKFIEFGCRVSASFAGFEASKQHYWEIESAKTKLRLIRLKLSKGFASFRESRPVFNKYHYFALLEK
jgi:ubiquinone/menaquinone biosynthesis C-methylase UbiE